MLDKSLLDELKISALTLCLEFLSTLLFASNLICNYSVKAHSILRYGRNSKLLTLSTHKP